MTDDIDRANERAEQMLADALRDQARRAGLAGKTVADSAFSCVDCDDDIPQLRREAIPGCQRCVYCQRDNERLT